MKSILILAAILSISSAHAGFKKPAPEAKQEAPAKAETKDDSAPTTPAATPSSEATAKSGGKTTAATAVKKPVSTTLTEADRVWLRKAANVIGKAN